MLRLEAGRFETGGLTGTCRQRSTRAAKTPRGCVRSPCRSGYRVLCGVPIRPSPSPPNLSDPESEEVLDLFEDFYGSQDPERLSLTVEEAREVQSGVSADPVMASGVQTIQGLRRLRQLLYGDEPPGAYGSSRTPDLEGAAVQEYPGGWFASRLKAGRPRDQVGCRTAGGRNRHQRWGPPHWPREHGWYAQSHAGIPLRIVVRLHG